MVIVLVSKSINHKILSYYNNLNIIIYVVTPLKYDTSLTTYNNIKFINDSEFLDRNEYDLIFDKVFEFEKSYFHSYRNWYYQQFLKYYIVLKLNYDKIHIIDGDSILDKNYISNNKFLYTNHKIDIRYNNFIKSFGYTTLNFNFITNQMVFEKEKLKQLLKKISVNENNICNQLLDLLKNKNYKFSEYQLYFTFLYNTYNYQIQKVKVHRRFDLLNVDINTALKHYTLISFENEHKTDIFRKIKSKLLYFLKFNYG